MRAAERCDGRLDTLGLEPTPRLLALPDGDDAEALVGRAGDVQDQPVGRRVDQPLRSRAGTAPSSTRCPARMRTPPAAPSVEARWANDRARRFRLGIARRRARGRGGPVEVRVLGPGRARRTARARSPCARASSNASLPRSRSAPAAPQSVDALIEAVWGERPPPSARKLLQVYVSQLRKLLPAPAANRERAETGYALELPDGSLDSARFERLLGEGQDALADGNPQLAVSRLSRALELWRGERSAASATRRSRAKRRSGWPSCAWSAWRSASKPSWRSAEHRRRAARPARIRRLHPLRERARALEMLALYRSGRQSEALEVYAEAREHLRDELGLEPGPALRELQGRILRQDPALTASPLVRGRRFVAAPRPRQTA